MRKDKGTFIRLLSAIQKSIVVVKAAFVFGSCINNCYGSNEL
jgi:hypothetical protein